MARRTWHLDAPGCPPFGSVVGAPPPEEVPRAVGHGPERNRPPVAARVWRTMPDARQPRTFSALQVAPRRRAGGHHCVSLRPERALSSGQTERALPVRQCSHSAEQNAHIWSDRALTSGQTERSHLVRQSAHFRPDITVTSGQTVLALYRTERSLLARKSAHFRPDRALTSGRAERAT